jgi:hypothetical protein
MKPDRDYAARGNGRRVKMGIEAPPELCILRVEKPATGI